MALFPVNFSNPTTPTDNNSPLGSLTPTPPPDDPIKNENQSPSGRVIICNRWSDKSDEFARTAYPLNGREVSIKIDRTKARIETHFFVIKSSNEGNSDTKIGRIYTFNRSFNLISAPGEQLHLTVLVDKKIAAVVSGTKTIFSSQIELLPYSKEPNGELGINVSFSFRNRGEEDV